MKLSIHNLYGDHDKRWQHRFAGIAFLFFLIKGLLWLMIPAATYLFYF